MKRLASFSIAAALGAALATPAVGQQAGLRTDIIGQIDDAGNKIIQLAEAIPQEKYSWRPAEGVRSVSEVFMHVAGANYFFVRLAGGPAAESQPPRGAETSVTDKAQVLDWLRRSFAHVRTAIGNMSDADLAKTVDMFGQQTTARNVLLVNASHCHEHLGQLIAYARSNAVVPPWSAAGGQ